MSKLDDQIDMDHPGGPAFFLPDIETGPIIELVAWIRQLVEAVDYAKLDITRDENGELRTFHDLSLVRAARLLGMDLYVNDMFRCYTRHVQSGIVSFEDVDSVVRLALETDATFLVQMGSRLGKMVLPGEAARVLPWLESYLDNHPNPKNRVDKRIAKSEECCAEES